MFLLLLFISVDDYFWFASTYIQVRLQLLLLRLHNSNLYGAD
jgi:hypothetical protein